MLYGQTVSAEDPRTPEQIAADYRLPIEAVREAISYCESNPPEIEEDFRRDEALLAATGMSDLNYESHGKPKVLSARDIAKIEGP